ncbi:hypothetical protein HR09_01550 [Porphyromonas gulae]|nr:hypothetical protein HR09_01550 [Porphyromonas gulae]
MLGLVYCFFNPEPNVWENISVLITLFYTLILYVTLWIRDRFDPAVFLLLVLIFGITLPFTVPLACKYLHHDGLNMITSVVESIGRIGKMIILTFTAFVFMMIDVAMKKKGINAGIKFNVNFLFSEFPIFLSFLILTVYAIILGEENIHKDGHEAFFSGVVAFQMIVSNIIWSINDDDLFNKKNI